MAYIKPSREEEENENNQQQAAPTQENVITSGGGGVIGGGSSGQSSGTASSQAGGKKPFTNLQSYLGANEGENAQRMGNQLEGFAENQVGSARTSKEQVRNDFNQQKQANTVQADDKLFEQVRTDPTQVVNNAGQVQSFQRQLNAQYQGPRSLTDIEGFGNVATNYNKASGTLRNLQSDSGTGQVLRETYQRPTYTQGENTLDSFIVRGDQGSRQNLENLSNRFSGISSLVNGTPQELQQAQQAATAAASTAEATTNATREAATNVFDTARSGVTQQYEGFQTKAAETEAQKQQTRDLFAQNDKATVLSITGMSPAAYDFIVSRGLDPSMFVSSTAAMTAGDLAGDDFRNKVSALETLGNQSFGMNLTPGGGSAEAFNVAADKVNTLDSGAPLVDAVSNEFSAADSNLRSLDTDIQQALSGGRDQKLQGLKLAGASPTLIQEASKYLDLENTDLAGFYQAPSYSRTHGDMVSSPELSALKNLQALFGQDFGLNLAQSGDQSKPSINADALTHQVEVARRQDYETNKGAAKQWDEGQRDKLGVAPIYWDLSRDAFGINPANYITPSEFGSETSYVFDQNRFIADITAANNAAMADPRNVGRVDPMTSLIITNPQRYSGPNAPTVPFTPEPAPKVLNTNPNNSPTWGGGRIPTA